MRTIVCIGTGPSLTAEQVDTARAKGFTLYACNNAIQLAPDAALLYAVNLAWWDHYWGDVRDLPCEKWTTNITAAVKYDINWIEERNRHGLSEDPAYIHHGHGSGYSLVSMAYRNGAERIVLLGYDLKYAPDYNGRAKHVGSTPRHFFGEYPEDMQHWPSVRVQGGVHTELLDLYASIHAQGLVQVVNCTPDSALECFEKVPIDAL